jgi:small subunit ribosomal protein S1
MTSQHRTVAEEDLISETMSAGEDMQSLMDAQESSGFRSLRRRQNVTGIVVSVAEDAVLVDVGTKSEGIVRREELSEDGDDAPELRYGQEVLVQVIEPESPQGPVLSLRLARREQAWVDMEALAAQGDTIEATVVDFNRGGAIADVRGVRAFIPISQLASLPGATLSPEGGQQDDTAGRLSQIVGRRLWFKVLEVDRSQNRLILSEKAAESERRDRRRQEMLGEIEQGQIRHGVVRNVTAFGAFVDLGGLDGLVHVSEMSYDRVEDPRSVLAPGQEVDVFVLEVRREDGRIALSLKRAMQDPWITAAERLQPGQTVEVEVRRLAKFGAFAQIEPGIEGLIHISELADVPPRDPGQVVHEGDRLQVKVIHVDPHSRRIGLSLRQMTEPQSAQMSVDDWHREQDASHNREESAFGVLSGLNLPRLQDQTGQRDVNEESDVRPAETATQDQDLPETGLSVETIGQSASDEMPAGDAEAIIEVDQGTEPETSGHVGMQQDGGEQQTTSEEAPGVDDADSQNE